VCVLIMANELKTPIGEINEVTSTKKIVLDISHRNRDTITIAIRDFRSNFDNRVRQCRDQLESQKTLLSTTEQSNEVENSAFEKEINDLENFKKESENTLQKNLTITNDIPSTDLENLNSENQTCDSQISELTKSYETSLKETEEVSKSCNNIVNELKECTIQMTNFKEQLEKMVKEENDFDSMVDKHNRELSDLLSISESTTNLVEKSLVSEFDSYNSSINSDGTSLSIISEGNIELNRQEHLKKAPEKLTSLTVFPECPVVFDIINNDEILNNDDRINGKNKWSEKQKKVYLHALTEHAKGLEPTKKLSKNQNKTIMQNVITSALKGRPEKHTYVDGTWCDVSSSEVDISEFSMDELAAHVENLTAELRAL